MSFQCRSYDPGGFVLPELMAVLAMLLIVTLMAVPALSHWWWRDRADAAAHSLLASFAFARHESLRLGQRVDICRDDGASQCAGTGQGCGEAGNARADNWACGWLVVIPGAAPASARVLKVFQGNRSLRIISPALALSFTPPVGQILGNFRTFEVSPLHGLPPDGSLARCIRIAAAGRARLSTGVCGKGA